MRRTEVINVINRDNLVGLFFKRDRKNGECVRVINLLLDEMLSTLSDVNKCVIKPDQYFDHMKRVVEMIESLDALSTFSARLDQEVSEWPEEKSSDNPPSLSWISRDKRRSVTYRSIGREIQQFIDNESLAVIHSLLENLITREVVFTFVCVDFSL